jgi:hypothetical protein
MSKFPVCNDCYFANRSPEICEGCENGSEFEAAETEREPVARGKPVKFHKPNKEFK